MFNQKKTVLIHFPSYLLTYVPFWFRVVRFAAPNFPESYWLEAIAIYCELVEHGQCPRAPFDLMSHHVLIGARDHLAIAHVVCSIWK